jgi:hypothetical protein
MDEIGVSGYTLRFRCSFFLLCLLSWHIPHAVPFTALGAGRLRSLALTSHLSRLCMCLRRYSRLIRLSASTHTDTILFGYTSALTASANCTSYAQAPRGSGSRDTRTHERESRHTS